uniref:Thioredoxin domain-containing protein n=1 Tax=Chromera velia CCMP2878 TaxID=1169474 RepID=A0A0G4FLX5_9ALVE|mmetsp:Transcript_52159/g.102134  ORF Transcript_52159/g.102134 Transcript_52159/m.102134 type:complete len:714 (+) Transcript_52159:207-2348(+)|eukprot:Cvel_17691.t1-p1 / transcript=Cvel_17691.t1 / gene=Cvel_17691 / organism=Chromera_velia_CCMP2878 / gene_product=Thioredoxin H-type, putative / transcript_product=Thioredoxin H-type, putative / location=Cvel_scaffold1427:39563-44324(-) / protein_length=713 / sequence_SO=supercontig / SO=protein_coding / is_pseudo=false
MEEDLVLFNTALGLKVESYDGGCESERLGIENALKGKVHCSDTGMNMNLCLKISEPALLTHVVVRGPRDCTAPIKTALFWASKTKIPFKSFSKKFNGYNQDKLKRLPKDTQNPPLVCLTTDEQFKECAIELEEPVEAQHFLFKFTSSWGEKNVDVGGIALAGYRLSNNLEGANNTDSVKGKEKVGMEPLKLLAEKERIEVFAWRPEHKLYDIGEHMFHDEALSALIKRGGLFLMCSGQRGKGEGIAKGEKVAEFLREAFANGEMRNHVPLGLCILGRGGLKYVSKNFPGFLDFLGFPIDRSDTQLYFVEAGPKRKFRAAQLPETVEEVVAFGRDSAESRGEPFVKSQEPPPNDRDPMHKDLLTVTGRTFDRIVLDPSLDVFLFAWAPCKPVTVMEPVITALAPLLRDCETVRICKIDRIQNEIEKERVPEQQPIVIRLFPATSPGGSEGADEEKGGGKEGKGKESTRKRKDKGCGVLYKGDGSLPSLLKFVHDNMETPQFDLSAKKKEATGVMKRQAAITKLTQITLLCKRKMEAFEVSLPPALEELKGLVDQMEKLLEDTNDISMEPEEIETLVQLTVEKATAANLDQLARKAVNKRVMEVNAEGQLGQFCDIAKAQGKVLVCQFFAVWAMPCLMFMPEYGRMSEEFQKQAVFCKVNVDTQKELLEKHKVDKPPAFLIFKNGEEVGRLEESIERDALVGLIAKHFGSETLTS